jgi:predicted nucleic acid-binding protein
MYLLDTNVISELRRPCAMTAVSALLAGCDRLFSQDMLADRRSVSPKELKQIAACHPL